MIAVLVFAHKNLSQTRRLINSLKHKEVDIYLHVDSKCSFDEKEFSDIFLLDRHDIKWSGASQVDALFESLRKITSIKKYDYYIFMSGQDYLIKPVADIVSFLKDNSGKEFIEYKDISSQSVANRYTEYHTRFRFVNAVLRRIMPKRKIFNDVMPYFGSCWWMLTGDAVTYMTSVYYEKYYKKLYLTSCIDEIIYQTILLNSSFASKIVNDNKWYIDWSNHSKGLNDGNPNVLTDSDFDSIVNSNKFIARKFDININDKILDMLDDYRGDL